MKLSSYTLCLATLLIASCSSAPNKDQWPNSLPSRAFFTDYYARDIANQQAITEHTYLTWIHRFYFGWELYSRGWLQATEEFEDSMKIAKDKPIAKRLMLETGRRIAPEWAKNKQHSVITTRHIVIWGNSINASIVNKNQMDTLTKIFNDVNALLERRMQPKEIIAERYYVTQAFSIQDDF
jgi:hypothetical protein